MIGDAARDLEDIFDEIENAEELDAKLQDRFKETIEALSHQVDKRLSYLDYAQTMAAQAKEKAELWTKRRKRFEQVIDYVKSDAKEWIKRLGIPLTGFDGAMKLVKNSKPTVILDVSIDDATCAYVPGEVPDSLVSQLLLDATKQYGKDVAKIVPYLKAKVVFSVDKEALLQSVRAGEDLSDLVIVEQGEHIRCTMNHR